MNTHHELDLIDSAALRGLGSDQTLVLMNGKRRHTTALVNIFGARNRGNTGTDMNAIPLLAIRNVQVLRDGAAAQYGSDAIAGVINIDMKKSLGCETVVGAGAYSARDGKNYLGSAYCGFQVGDKGVIGITAEALNRGRSNREVEESPRIIGDSLVKNRTLYVNGDIPMGVEGKLYFTGGVQDRYGSSAAWGRGGIGSDDIPSKNSAAMYPDGFAPFINADVDDRCTSATAAGTGADFSQTYGQQDALHHRPDLERIDRQPDHGGGGISLNSWMLAASNSAITTNADFSRFYSDVLGGLNVGMA
jgi:iron complex outermembrane receptor protein